MNHDTPLVNNRENLETIRGRCKVLDAEIAQLTQDLNGQEELYRKIRNFNEVEKRLEGDRKELTNWPRGVFGIKNKKEYNALLSEIRNLEETQKDNLRELEEEQRSESDIEQAKTSLLDRIKSLRWERRKIGVKLFEKPGRSDLGEALEIYKDRFFGPEEVSSVFGLALKPEDIPALPPKEKLEKISDVKEKMLLVLVIKEGESPEWKIFPGRVVRETESKDYAEETRGIRDFLKKYDLITSEELEETSDEVLDRLAEEIKTNEAEAFNQLVSMRINQTRRHSAEDMIYFTRLTRGEASDNKHTSSVMSGLKNRQTSLDDSFESTKTFTVNNKEVWVKKIGKFTDHRGGGYVQEDSKPTSNQTEGWQGHYQTGVRVVV